MSRGLKALARVKHFMSLNCKHWKQDIGYIEEELKAGEKYKKALEIIKKCPMFSLHDDMPQGTYRMYDCELYSHYDLTKDKFDLLKEVMK